jgi:hypothetical protein
MNVLNARVSLFGVGLLLAAGAVIWAVSGDDDDLGALSENPRCGNCTMTLDLQAQDPVRKVSLVNIEDFSGCIDGPPWNLVEVRVYNEATWWSYEPEGGQGYVGDLEGPHSFLLNALGTEPSAGTTLDKVRFTLESTSSGKKHDRGCIAIEFNGAPQPEETDCDKKCTVSAR